MPTHILKSFIFLSLLILLSSCSNSSDEFDTYFNSTYPDLEEDATQVDDSTKKYEALILDLNPEEAMETLNNEVISDYETLLEKIKNVNITETNIIRFNNAYQNLIEINLNKQLANKNTFEEIKVYHEDDKLEEFDVNKASEEMDDLYEESKKRNDKLRALADELMKNNDSLKLTNIEEVNVKLLKEKDIELMNKFIESMDKNIGKSTEDNKLEIDEALLADQGNPEVVLQGDVIVKNERFVLTGKSNLLGGAILNVQSYQYGAENAYFKGDFQVDDHGDFELEMDVDKDKLNNEPYIVQIAYLPETSDDVEAHSIYGKLGEKLTGKFIQKYTTVKKTRHGAFAYAYTELTPDTKVPLINQRSDAPDDYGDFKVWMEKDKVETKDVYYDITMQSNLNELTKIKADVKVVDHDVAGLNSSTIVGPDGSFRFRIPRPDPEDIDNKDVIIKIEATSDGAFETEEIYGVHGDKFRGDLVKETKRGQKIEYKLHLGNDS